MGATMEQVQQGVLDVGNLIVRGMETWDKLTNRPTGTPAASTGPIVEQPAVTGQAQAFDQSATGAGLNSPLLLVGGAILLVLLLRGR